MAKQRFILTHMLSPGDMVCLSALVRDIHLTYPGEFETDVFTTVTPIWDNNPYITKLWNHDYASPQITVAGAKFVKCDYGKGLREQKTEPIHFCQYFHRDFERQTGIPVKFHHPFGDIHLSDQEKAVSPIDGRYWLLISGGKSDFTIKVWNTTCFQQVVDMLGEAGLGVVQTGAVAKGHWHPALHGDNLINLCGWGNFREFAQQIYHADGVICGVTAAMHMAAALHKPCVVLAGGREAWWWEAYVRENLGLGDARKQLTVPHRFLHTISQFDCCKQHGCWRDKVVKIDRSDSLCALPILTNEMPVAACMHAITPEQVVTAALSYYADGTLPPQPATQDFINANMKAVTDE